MDGFLPDLQVLDTAAICAAVPDANEIHPELADPSLINLKAWLLKIGSFINQSSFWTVNRLSKLIVNQQTFLAPTGALEEGISCVRACVCPLLSSKEH